MRIGSPHLDPLRCNQLDESDMTASPNWRLACQNVVYVCDEHVQFNLSDLCILARPRSLSQRANGCFAAHPE